MKMINALRVKLLSSKGKLPTKETSSSAGYDLTSAQQLVIPKGGRALVQTNISISVPKGTYGRIAPRSGLALKHSINMGAGVIDADYTGPIGIIIFNHGNQDFQVQEGDRISQLILKQIANKPVVAVQELTHTQRGDKGFGSTGSQQINTISGRKGNNKSTCNTLDQTRGIYGKDDLDGKQNAYKKSPLQLLDLCNKENILERHAPSPPNAHEEPSALPPEPLSGCIPSVTPNRTAPLPSAIVVLGSKGWPSAFKNRAWNSSSESCLNPSSSLSQTTLQKSRNLEGGEGHKEEKYEEEETDSNSGSDSLEGALERTGVESPCPSLP